MRGVMTEQDYRCKMQAWKKSLHVTDGMELIDVELATLDREKAASEQKKKAAGRGQLPLKVRLVLLIKDILSQEIDYVDSRKGAAANDR